MTTTQIRELFERAGRLDDFDTWLDTVTQGVFDEGYNLGYATGYDVGWDDSVRIVGATL